MIINLGLIGGLGFIKQFGQASLYSGLALLTLNTIKIFSQRSVFDLNGMFVSLISVMGIVMGVVDF